jgi:hypothetical protein
MSEQIPAEAAEAATPLVEPTPDLAGEPVVAVIELEEFQADRQDPSWQGFLRKAKLYGKQLEAEGRDT